VLVHRLLQELPRFEATQQKERAKRYLDRFAADIPEGVRAAITGEALKVINAPELAELFGPGSRAEVSILGKWNQDVGPFEDFGRVDRLAVTGDAVWIADFKSDAFPPSAPGDAPRDYLTQLARYRAVLAKLYPNRAMRAFLVWTTKGAVHEIPTALLDKAFAGFTAA
jgi:ATP-dependent helicase/nuclease subunit A